MDSVIDILEHVLNNPTQGSRFFLTELLSRKHTVHSMSRLHQQFPDLSQSVIQAVQTQYSKTEAVKILQQLANSEPSEQDKHRMLAELADYKALGSETILRVLKENAWDVEQAVLPLFNLLAEANTAPSKQKGEDDS